MKLLHEFYADMFKFYLMKGDGPQTADNKAREALYYYNKYLKEEGFSFD